MSALADPSVLLHAGLIELVATFVVCLFSFVGLRFLRRGAARFWTAPAIASLALLPLVIGCQLTNLAIGRALAAVAMTGSTGVAAIAAGSAEALVALMMGLACTATLGAAGGLIVALGTSRVRDGEPGGGLVFPLAAFGAAILAGGHAALVLRTVKILTAGSFDPQALLARSRLVAVGAAGLMLLLLALCVLTALRAPRGAAPLSVRLLSLSTFLLMGIGSLVGLWLAYGHVRCLTAAALTGVPCGGGPAVAAHSRVGTRPDEPPPVATAAPAADEGVDGDVMVVADGGVYGGVAEVAPPPPARVVRIGGQFGQPKLIKRVEPKYPVLAAASRVSVLVILEAEVDTRGYVKTVTVLRGQPLFDEAATDAVKQWRYQPLLLNGVPTGFILTVTINLQQK